MERGAELELGTGRGPITGSTERAGERELVRAEAAPQHGDEQPDAQFGRAAACRGGHHGGPGNQVPVRHFVEHGQRAPEEPASGVGDEEVVRGEGVAGHAVLEDLRVEVRRWPRGAGGCGERIGEGEGVRRFGPGEEGGGTPRLGK